MSKSLYNVLKRPLVTEKTNGLRDANNQYAFEVDRGANKVEIRDAIETIFGVRVTEVNTAIVRGKMKRTRKSVGKKPNWKKAVVRLHDDDQIELFEGV
ncbi:MAG: large subunit ribosomal protein L23 [Myxococcota bacterium]|jgi:large subunit ribosomal protein L23